MLIFTKSIELRLSHRALQAQGFCRLSEPFTRNLLAFTVIITNCEMLLEIGFRIGQAVLGLGSNHAAKVSHHWPQIVHIRHNLRRSMVFTSGHEQDTDSDA